MSHQLHFRTTFRTAALHLLEYTPLGAAVRRVGTVADEDGLLTIETPGRNVVSLSTGEWALLDFLASLGGVGPVYLGPTLAHLDDESQHALWWSLGVATGHLSDVAPVRFSA